MDQFTILSDDDVDPEVASGDEKMLMDATDSDDESESAVVNNSFDFEDGSFNVHKNERLKRKVLKVAKAAERKARGDPSDADNIRAMVSRNTKDMHTHEGVVAESHVLLLCGKCFH